MVRIALVIVLVALGACAGGEDLDYAAPGEIPPGKGLFTGDDGKFTLDL